MSGLKIWIIVALSFIVGAVVCFLVAIVAVGGDFTKFNITQYRQETYSVQGQFDEISIKTNTETDVVFALSQDGACKVVCWEAKKVKYFLSVNDGALEINGVDTRKWYEKITIYSPARMLTVYLPESEYAALTVQTDTGDIKLTNAFTFGSLDIQTYTGDVCVKNLTVTGELFVKVRTGDVKITDVTCGKYLGKATTGKIALSKVIVDGNFTLETSTGDVSLKETLVGGALTVSVGTGDVKFENSDATSLSVKTSTGDVTGTLLTDKIFIAKSNTGDVDVPKTTAGGRCEIRTSTGDIRIKIASLNG